ncbi:MULTISPECIES: hypothetical protein [unclassified Microcoleus]|uniref:hypothetical protein n=1 Tax=unclassified Microcoleus TaxID=2642155 RepID=UPI002FD08CE7
MTDSSSLANALSEPLRQPFWWAALASITLHGALGVSAPTLSNILYGGNSSKNLPGSVGFVELTAAEVSRLPQTIPPRPSNTPFSIAPVPLGPSPKLAAPLPPAPPTINLPALPPGMPPPGFFSPLPSSPLPPFTAPTAPPPPKTPSPTVRTPSLTTPTLIPQVPPGIQIFPPLPGNFDRNIPPPPPSVTGEPQLPGGPLEDEAETLKRTIASRGGLPLFPDGAPVFTPEFPIGPRNSGDGGPKLTQKDPNKRNLIAETPEERNKRQQFEEGQQQLQQPGQPSSNLPTDRETQLAAANTYVALFDRFKKAYPDLEMTAPTPVNVAYPAAACSQKLEGTAVFGAVVNPQGLLRAEPQPIVPTGYGILDNAAKTAIIDTSLIFPPASTHKLYQVAVAFKYDEKVCSGIPATSPTAPTRSRPTGQQPPAVAPTVPRPTAQPPSPAPAEVKPQFEKPPAASNKPQPGTQPSPPPAQKAAPKPSPSPQPKPAAEVSPPPEAAPSPAPEVSPSPEAAPSPAPEVSPPPEAAPSPTPEVSPSPEAAPSPTPEVSPSPATEN